MNRNFSLRAKKETGQTLGQSTKRLVINLFAFKVCTLKELDLKSGFDWIQHLNVLT